MSVLYGSCACYLGPLQLGETKSLPVSRPDVITPHLERALHDAITPHLAGAMPIQELSRKRKGDVDNR